VEESITFKEFKSRIVEKFERAQFREVGKYGWDRLEVDEKR